LSPLKSNKLNDLSAKEWTQLSTSVILFSSKKELLKRLSRIYSKKNSDIGYFSFQESTKWRKRTLLSRKYFSEFTSSDKFELVILDLEGINSITGYLNAEKWLNKKSKYLQNSLKPNKYLLVIVENFSDPKENINFFPTHQFIIQILEYHNFLHTDLWALSNVKSESFYSPTFLLCFKKSEDMIQIHKKIVTNDFINANRIPYLQKRYSYSKVIQGFSSVREPEYVRHGATFPQPLIEYFLTIFTKNNDTILDIFSGVGLSLFAAQNLGRNAIGIELNPQYIKWTKTLEKRKFGSLMGFISEKPNDQNKIRLINDNNQNLQSYVEKNSIDLMITSPPYFNILHKVVEEAERRGSGSVFRRRKKGRERNIQHLDGFLTDETSSNTFLPEERKDTMNIDISSLIPHPYSGDEKDLGNITTYEEFLRNIEMLHNQVLDVLKPGGFAIWIIRDFRDMQTKKPYVNFHSDLANLAVNTGFIYYDLIVWNQNRERRLIHLGGGNTYYNSMTMSFIVVLQKPKEK
jgi:DNA modification methylase